MPHSSASSALLLPFGSLTGIIPIDAVPRGRVIGDASRVIEGSASRGLAIQQQIHSVIDPALRASTSVAVGVLEGSGG